MTSQPGASTSLLQRSSRAGFSVDREGSHRCCRKADGRECRPARALLVYGTFGDVDGVAWNSVCRSVLAVQLLTQ